MKFIDLFAGIGGFRTGMEKNGHECVAFCEIDKYARQSYKAIYDTEGEEELHDITKWTDEHVRQFIRDRGHIDVITGGFPCQSFSIAGKRGGFDDTRGTLFFEIMRIANIIRPQYLFLENVKGLLNHDGGATFETILNTLDEFGYDAEWQVLNSKNFGVPQNRERVFIIGHLRGSGGRTVFPVGGDDEKTTKLQRQSLSTNTLTARYEGVGNGSYVIESEQYAQKGLKIKEATKKGYAVAEPGDSVNISFPDSETRRGRVGKQTANTLLTGEEQAVVLGGVYTNDSIKFHRGPLKGLSMTLKSDNHDAGVTDGFRIRKLTPLECWRLQGFTDEQFYKAKNDGVSNSQLYKQAGNSVTVNVIDTIAKRL